MVKIAVVGSRELHFTNRVINKLASLARYTPDLKFISGGAKGVDTIVQGFAKAYNFDIEVIRPINPANKLDYLFRNVEIITKADKIIAFWNGTSKGTKFVINYAKARNKDVEIIGV